MLAVDIFILGLLFILTGVLYYVLCDIARKRFITVVNYGKSIIMGQLLIEESIFMSMKPYMDPEAVESLEERFRELHKLVKEYEELEF